MTEPEILAIYGAPFQQRPTARQNCLDFLLLPPLKLYLLLNDGGLLLIKHKSKQHCHIGKSELCIAEFVCVCEREGDCMYVCVFVKGALAVVRSLPCSICHSFGVEDKHTDQNGSDHKTISVWICLLLFAS